MSGARRRTNVAATVLDTFNLTVHLFFVPRHAPPQRTNLAPRAALVVRTTVRPRAKR